MKNGRDPSGSLNLDEADQRLIALLAKDGRMMTRALAAELGVTDVTVAARIRRLIEDRIIIIGPQFDWESVGFRSQAVVYLKVSGRTPLSVAEKIGALSGVFMVSTTYGDADVVALLLAAGPAEMQKLLMAVQAVPGVIDLRADGVVETLACEVNTSVRDYQPMSIDEFPDPPYELDDIDGEIISRLRLDGRVSSREMARDMSVSDVTVRNRLRRMQDSGFLRVAAMIDPIATGLVSSLAYVGFVVDRDPGAVIKQMTTRPWVTFFASTNGGHNFVALVATSSEEHLVHLLTQTLWEIRGVRTVQAWRLCETAAYRPDLVRLLPGRS